MIKKLITLPSILYIKIRTMYFRKKFFHIGSGTGFGKIGYGDECKLDGLEYMYVGDSSWFGKGTKISVIYKNATPICKIGNNVNATARLQIVCVDSVEIGNDVLIAPDVFITDEYFNNNPDKELGGEGVVIGEGVWIGQKSIVLPGVTVGKHSIIGANSIVTFDIPAYCIVAGQPAKIIKQWDFEHSTWVRYKGISMI